MKQIFKTLALAVVAIMTISGLSSCVKNIETHETHESNGYRFEYSDVSFDSCGEYASSPATQFSILKMRLGSVVMVAPDEAFLVGLADDYIKNANHQGINATVRLKKGSSTIKEWKLEAIDFWTIEVADPE